MKYVIAFITILILLPSCSKKIPTSKITVVKEKEYVDRKVEVDKAIVESDDLPKEIIRIPIRNGDTFSSIKKLLLSGYPETKQTKPLVPLNKQDDFLKSDFYKYLQEPTFLEKYLDSRYDTVLEIGVNIHLLRDELVRNKYISRFGL